MYVRFHIDRTTGEPHIYEHNVAESEALEILRTSTDRGGARDGAMQAIGPTSQGRFLNVVYAPEPGGIVGDSL